MDNAFTQNIIRMGREHGFALGLARAIELLRQNGVEVDHPARQAVFAALMREKPTED
jgi:histidyl-tRNA synthetase